MSQDREKQKKESKPIVNIVVFIVVFIAAFVLTKVVFESLIFKKNKKPSQKELQAYNDAGFAKGFIAVNTTVLESFCSSSGYIPNEFINDFNNRFSKTNENADKILNKYMKKEEVQKLIVSKASSAGLVVLESEYNKIKTNSGITKKEFCQLFDNQKSSIIEEKIKIFKQNKPLMYLD